MPVTENLSDKYATRRFVNYHLKGAEKTLNNLLFLQQKAAHSSLRPLLLNISTGCIT